MPSMPGIAVTVYARCLPNISIQPFGLLEMWPQESQWLNEGFTCKNTDPNHFTVMGDLSITTPRL